jgi:phosphoribulokinase
MDFNEYQKLIQQTATYPENGTGSSLALAYCALGLNGEAGELAGKLGTILECGLQIQNHADVIAEKIKKIIRDGKGFVTPEVKTHIIKEGGDVLWYLAKIFSEINVVFDEVPIENIRKLLDRKSRGVLGGSGDNR